VEWNEVIGLARRCSACYPIARANNETANGCGSSRQDEATCLRFDARRRRIDARRKGKVSRAGDVPQLVLSDQAVLREWSCKERVDGEWKDVLP
jgi:hypothetical protein